jgi:hypothetical protein
MGKTSKKLDGMIVEMIAAASAYCSVAGIKMTTLGRLIMNDGEFFENLEKANNCTIKTYRKVMRELREREHKAKPNLNINECRP